MRAVPEEVTSILVLFLVGLIIFIILDVTAAVLLGLATYNDAKSRLNDSPALWGVLVGVLGFIPGIIYLCMRNNALNRLTACPNCGWATPLGQPACLRCGAPNPYLQGSMTPQQQQQLRHKAAVMLIWAIVLFVLAFIALIIFIVFCTMQGLDAAYTYSYMY